MVCGPAERAQICDDIGDSLYRLITKVTESEASIYTGPPDLQLLLDFVHEGGEIINHLEVAYIILEHSKTHGPGPYPEDQLAQIIGRDQASINQVLDELAEQGIINPRTTA